MDRAIKQRILGTLVLLAGSAALAPLVLDGSGTVVPHEVSLPPRPVVVPPPVSPMVWSGASTQAPAPELQDAPPLVTPTDQPVAQLPPRVPPSSGTAPAPAEQAVSPGVTPSVAQEKITVAVVKKPMAEANDELHQNKPVPSHPPVPDLPKAWTVQVASLTSAEAARALRSELLRRGYPVYQRQLGTAYKVFVGPEFDKAKAESFKERLAKEGYAGWMQVYNVH